MIGIHVPFASSTSLPQVPIAAPRVWSRVRGPVHGPYAETWFDGVARVPRVRLTEEGRRMVAEYLSRYPHPIALLIATWPAAYRAARVAGLSNEEIDSLCLEGVTKAFVRYDPDRGAAIGTVVVWGLRAAIGNAVRSAKRQAVLFERRSAGGSHSGRSLTRRGRKPVTDACAIGVNASVDEVGSESDPEGSATASQQEASEEVAIYLSTAGLTERERTVLELRFGLNDAPKLNSVEIGRSIGISTERVRQLQENAIRKIRQTVGLDVDWFRTACERIVAFLASLSAPGGNSGDGTRADFSTSSTKATICRRTDVPLWQFRAVVAQLVREGLVIRERRSISRSRWCIVFRLNRAVQRAASEWCDEPSFREQS